MNVVRRIFCFILLHMCSASPLPPQINTSTRSLSKEAATCPTRCDPGNSCVERDNKIGCQSCTRGYFSDDGYGCQACHCAKGGTQAAICHRVTGQCFCDNILNLCSKVPIFGSSSTLVWFLLVATAVSFLVFGQCWLQSRRYPVDEAVILDQSVAMAQLQQVMAQLQSAGAIKQKINSYKSESPSPGISSKSNISKKLNSISILHGRRLQSRSRHTQQSELDEVTTAILNVAKEKIHEGNKRSVKDKMSRGQSRAGVEGEYYIDRITGKPVMDIAMDAEAEGQILSVIFPAPDDNLNYKAKDNLADTTSPRSFIGFGDEDATSIHFVDSSVFRATDVREPSPAKKLIKKKVLRKVK